MLSSALWQSCNMSEKSIKKYPTLEIDFSVNFHRKMYQFLHEGFLTPQEWRDEFFKKKVYMQAGKKAKNVKGVFFIDKTGLNLNLSQKEIFFVKRTFVKNTP